MVNAVFFHQDRRGELRVHPVRGLNDRPNTRFAPPAIEKWVLGNLGSIEHERRVATIATKLFDLTWPLHGLGQNDLRILQLAAIVHDVGRAVDDETHPEQGARMLIEADHLPLDGSERRALAYLTRYHRGKPPQIGVDEILRRHDDHESLRLTLALLRSADGLDSRAIESPRLMFALLGRQLQITCLLDNDTAKARKVYSRRKKHRLMEDLLGCRVDVRVVPIGALQMVA
jgi:exopolyphosphatase / guanosine-5'-triphosphate,3'-diphosphate pyrophosphatase